MSDPSACENGLGLGVRCRPRDTPGRDGLAKALYKAWEASVA